jgi:hypothetical protein
MFHRDWAAAMLAALVVFPATPAWASTPGDHLIEGWKQRQSLLGAHRRQITHVTLATDADGAVSARMGNQYTIERHGLTFVLDRRERLIGHADLKRNWGPALSSRTGRDGTVNWSVAPIPDGRVVQSASGGVSAGVVPLAPGDWVYAAAEVMLFSGPDGPIDALSAPYSTNVEVAQDPVTGWVVVRKSLKGGHWRNEFEFAPEHQWMLVRSSWNAVGPDGAVLADHTWTVTQVGRTHQGVSYPKVIECRIGPDLAKRLAADAGMDPDSEYVDRFETTEFVTGLVLPEGWARPRFPAGSRCYDTLHDLSFIAGQAVVVTDDKGVAYHVPIKHYQFLEQYTDPSVRLDPDSPQGRKLANMLEKTRADIIDGKVVPLSVGAIPATTPPPRTTAGHADYFTPTLYSALATALVSGTAVFAHHRPRRNSTPTPS